MISVPPTTSLQPRRWPCRDRASGKLPIRRAQSRLSTQCRTNTVNKTNNRCQSQTPRVYTCTEGIKLHACIAVGSTRVTSLARSTNDKQQQGATIRTECPSTSVSHPVRGYKTPRTPRSVFLLWARPASGPLGGIHTGINLRINDATHVPHKHMLVLPHNSPPHPAHLTKAGPPRAPCSRPAGGAAIDTWPRSRTRKPTPAGWSPAGRSYRTTFRRRRR